MIGDAIRISRLALGKVIIEPKMCVQATAAVQAFDPFDVWFCASVLAESSLGLKCGRVIIAVAMAECPRMAFEQRLHNEELVAGRAARMAITLTSRQTVGVSASRSADITDGYRDVVDCVVRLVSVQCSPLEGLFKAKTIVAGRQSKRGDVSS